MELKNYRRIALGIVAFGFFVRIMYLVQFSGLPVADVMILDSLAYDQTAQTIAFGDGMPREPFFQAPLYPYFLSVIYSIFGVNYTYVRLIQICLGTLTILLVMGVTHRLWGRFPSILAGLMIAGYPVLIFQSALILKTTLNIFLMAMVLYLLIGNWPASRPIRFLLAGLFTGLSATGQATIVLHFPLIALWIIVQSGWKNIRQWMMAGVMFSLGAVAVIGSVTARNYLVSGEFVLLTSQGGANFYIGNSPYSDGTSKRPPRVRMTPEHERDDFHREAEAALNRTLTARESSQYWKDQAWNWIRSHPRDALKLQLRKLGLIWNRVEIPDNFDFDFYRQISPWIRFPRYPFQFVMIFGLIGMGISHWRKSWFLAAWALLYSAIFVAFHVYSRYRLPMVVFLSPFAGYSLSQLSDAFKYRRWKYLAGYCLAACILGIFSSLPLTHYSHAQAYFNLAAAYSRTGDEHGAVEMYEKSLVEQPDYVPSMVNLGKVWYRRGEVQRARKAWKEALRLDPNAVEAHNNLGTLAVQAGELDTAEYHFRRAVEIQPYYELAWIQLGQVLQISHRNDEALDCFRRALALNSENVAALYGRAKSADEAGIEGAAAFWRAYIAEAGGMPGETSYLEYARERLRQIEFADS